MRLLPTIWAAGVALALAACAGPLTPERQAAIDKACQDGSVECACVADDASTFGTYRIQPVQIGVGGARSCPAGQRFAYMSTLFNNNPPTHPGSFR